MDYTLITRAIEAELQNSAFDDVIKFLEQTEEIKNAVPDPTRDLTKTRYETEGAFPDWWDQALRQKAYRAYTLLEDYVFIKNPNHTEADCEEMLTKIKNRFFRAHRRRS